jgi:hypothetical protein
MKINCAAQEVAAIVPYCHAPQRHNNLGALNLDKIILYVVKEYTLLFAIRKFIGGAGAFSSSDDATCI